MTEKCHGKYVNMVSLKSIIQLLFSFFCAVAAILTFWAVQNKTIGKKKKRKFVFNFFRDRFIPVE